MKKLQRINREIERKIADRTRSSNSSLNQTRTTINATSKNDQYSNNQIEKKIIDFIRDNYAKGRSIKDIERDLHTAGFSKEDVRSALKKSHGHIWKDEFKKDIVSKISASKVGIGQFGTKIGNVISEHLQDKSLDSKLRVVIKEMLLEGKTKDEIEKSLSGSNFDKKTIDSSLQRALLIHRITAKHQNTKNIQISTKGINHKSKEAEIATKEKQLEKKIKLYVDEHSNKGKVVEHLNKGGFDRDYAEKTVSKHTRNKRYKSIAALATIGILLIFATIFVMNSNYTGLFSFDYENNTAPIMHTNSVDAYKNSQTNFNLGELFSDSDKDPLYFNIKENKRLNAQLVGTTLRVEPDNDFVGEEKIKISVTDLKASKEFTLAVNVLDEEGRSKEFALPEDIVFSVTDRFNRPIGNLTTNITDSKKIDLVVEGSEYLKREEIVDNSRIQINGLVSVLPEVNIKIDGGIDKLASSQIAMISDSSFESATLRLNKDNNTDIVIMRCTSFDIELFVCFDWVSAELEFVVSEINTTSTVEFNISESGAYGAFSKEILADTLKENVETIAEQYRGVVNSKGQDIEYNRTENGDITEIKLADVHIEKIRFKDLNKTKEFALGIEKLNILELDNLVATKSFAVDPTQLEFTNATMTLTAKGTKLFKCKEWNFTTQTCYGSWQLHLDNLIPGKTYEVNLTPDDPGFVEAIEVLNLYSHPTVGGNWTVYFNTSGTANLTITAITNTTWSDFANDSDLRFLELRCGNSTPLTYQWLDNGQYNRSVFIEDYNCDNLTSTEASAVLTPGAHHLEFRFGAQVAYANNFASSLSISGATTMCGNVSAYDQVTVTGTGTLTICAYNSSPGSGYVNLSLGVQGNFTILSGGSVSGAGKGHVGGAASSSTVACSTQGGDGNTKTNGTTSCLANGGGGSGAKRLDSANSIGGAGGAFGGAGGKGGYSALGTQSAGGNVYGTSGDPNTILFGSGGGGASGDVSGSTPNGATGGGGFRVDAGSGHINVFGSITMTGDTGSNGDSLDDSGGGGGSGGQIILMSRFINIQSSTITANGGAGGSTPGAGTSSDSCGGGGGGGGRILFVYESLSGTALTNTASGGAKGAGGDAACDTAGDAGTSTAGSVGNITHNQTNFNAPPSVANLSPISGIHIMGPTTVVISADVIKGNETGVNVDTVTANISQPNGTSLILTLTNYTVGNNTYYNNFSVPELYGRYNITILANNTLGLLNYSETTYFVAYDINAPNVTDLSPVNGSVLSISQRITAGALVIDANAAIDVTTATIYMRNGTTQEITLNDIGNNNYSNNVTLPNIEGQHNITFFANNTNGNYNSSEISYFNLSFPGYTQNVSYCDAQSFSSYRTFDSGCNLVSQGRLQRDDGTTEVLTATSGFWGGVRIQSFDTSITNCDSINSVEVCSEWWSTVFVGDADTCEMLVDADGGISYTVISSTCPGSTVNPGVQCMNVTTSETWTCENFFGPSGTRAFATASLNTSGSLYSNHDVLYFRVAYTNTSAAPNVTNLSPVNGTIFNVSERITVGAIITDTLTINVTNATLNMRNGTTQGITLISLGNNNYSNNVTLTNIEGQHNITFFANNSGAGFNSSEISYFNLSFAGLTQKVSDCAADDNSLTKGAFASTCDTTNGSALQNDESTVEVQTASVGTWGGVRIQSVDTTTTTCNAINSVELCHEWWAGTLASCEIAVDADEGASYTVISSTCPGSTANPGVQCMNVTTSETWTCANFFGTGGTRAYATAEANSSGAGTPISQDVLYFRVVYTNTTTTSPNITLAQTDTSDPIKGGLRFNYTINLTNAGTATATDVNVTDVLPTGISFVSSSPTQLAQNGQTINWTVNVSGSSTQTIRVVVDANLNLYHGSTLTNIVNSTYYNTTDTLTLGKSETTSAVCGYLNASLTLATNIATPGGGDCFVINVSNIVVDGAGYNMTGDGSYGGGINVTGKTNVTIKNFGNISDFNVGINITSSTNINVSNNTFQSTEDSDSKVINLMNTTTSTIDLNTHQLISGGALPVGSVILALKDSNSNNITRNNLNSRDSSGVAIIDGSSTNIIKLNNITNTGGTAIRINQSNANNLTQNRFNTSTSGYAIKLDSGNNTIIEYNTLQTGGASGYAIYLVKYAGVSNVDGTNITGNNITTTANTAQGIYLQNTTNTLINGANNITTSGISSHGIYLTENTTSTRILSNTISTNGLSADTVYLDKVDGNNISSNTLSTTGIVTASGVLITDGKNNEILTNSITASNIGFGVRITSAGSSNNSINNNQINTVSSHGISIDTSASTTQVNRNTITTTGSAAAGISMAASNHNIFSSNNIQKTGTLSAAIVISNSDNNTFTNDALNATNSAEIEAGLLSELNKFYNIYMKNLSNFTSIDINYVNVTYNISPATDPTGLKNMSDYYNIVNLSSSANINFSVNYTDAEALTATAIENTLKFFKYNSVTTTYEDVTSSSVDTTTNTINSGNLTAFSDYASFGTQFASVTATKTDSEDPIAEGSILNYTVTLTNTGGNATWVNITDTIPNNTIYVSSSPTPIAINGRTINWTTNVSASGMSIIVVNVNLSLNFTNNTVINNTASIVYFNGTDPKTTNATQNTTITASDSTPPSVTALLPSGTPSYNVSRSIEIGANVTDVENPISSVTANITLPNGTIDQSTLTLVAGTNKYNNSYQFYNLTGTYTLRIIATDLASNINSTETAQFIVVDQIPPNVSVLQPTNGTYVIQGDSIAIRSRIEDHNNISLVRAIVVWSDGGQNLTMNIEEANVYNLSFSNTTTLGQYNLTIFANDTFNNINDSEMIVFNVTTAPDITPPIVTLVSPANNSWTNSQNITFSYNVTDDYTIEYCNITIDGIHNATDLTVSKNTTQSFAVANLTEATHLWNISCLDDGQNVANSSTYLINIDRTLPTANILSPVNNSNTSDPTPPIIFNLTDGLSTQLNYTIYINDTANGQNGTVTNNTNTNLSISPALAQQSHRIVIEATDLAGNKQNSTDLYITIGPPTVYLVSPENNHKNMSGTLNFTFYVVDPGYPTLDCNFSIDGAVNQTNSLVLQGINTTFSVTSMAEGINRTWSVNCVNGGGNTGSDDRLITIDRTAPSVTALIPTNGSNYNTSQTIEISANISDADGISISVANITYPNASIEQINLTNIAGTNKYNASFTTATIGGSYSILYLATDLTGNTNNTQTSNFSVSDVAPPLVTALKPVNGTRINSSATLEISANVTDGGTVSFVYANITLPNSTILQLTLSQVGATKQYNASFGNTTLAGTYNITYIANDTSANINATEKSNFTVNTAASVTLLYPANGNTSVFERTVNLQYSGSDADSDTIVNYDINLTSASAQSYFFENITTTNYTTPLLEVDTVYNWTVRAYDGNEEGAYATKFNFTIASVVELNLTNAEIAFGPLLNTQSNDTSTNNPSPFTIENVGNVMQDVDIYAPIGLWNGTGLNTSYFQFKADNSSETGSFNTTGSTITFANMTGTAQGVAVRLLKQFNFSNANDTAEIDIKITVPSNESSGDKIATVRVVGGVAS